MKRYLLVWLILLALCLSSRASHIAGGNIEMVALDRPGQFQLSLNLYIDDASKTHCHWCAGAMDQYRYGVCQRAAFFADQV